MPQSSNLLQPYTNQELAWLLENIAHPDSDIRDKLVYAIFCHILLNSLITREQAQELLQLSLDTKPFSLEGPTLKRSFTCLLYCLLAVCRYEPESIYHAFLSTNDRELLFQQALDYLAIENDWSGYDENPAGSTPLRTLVLIVGCKLSHQISCPKKQRDIASHSYLSI